MPGVSTSLCAGLDWYKALSAMGLDVLPVILPQTAPCPLCVKGKITTYEDSITRGYWHHCHSCGFAGDTIELAAAVWKTDIPGAIQGLKAAGISFPSDTGEEHNIERYRRNHIRYRERMNNLFEQSRKYLHTEPDGSLIELQHRFNFATRGRRWQGVAKQLIGGLPITEIERCFHQNSRNTAHRTSSGLGGIFERSEPWNSVLVLPFYTLPQRISAFLFVGRQGRDRDHVFRVMPGGSTHPSADSGLFMLNSLSNGDPETDGHILIDPLLALRLQLRHLRENDALLPVAGSRSGPARQISRKAARSVTDRRLVFWGRDHVEAVRQAYSVDGYVTFARGPANETQTSKYLTQNWLGKLSRTAKHWTESLEHLIWSGSLHDCKRIIDTVGLSAEARRQFAADCSAGVRRRIERAFEEKAPIKTIHVGRHVIQDDGECWRHPNGGIVTDAPFAVETIFAAGVPIVQGQIRYKGQQIPFTEKLHTLEGSTGGWLRRKVVATGLGMPIVATQASRALLNIAQTFHPPVINTQLPKYGWHQDSFLFPHFTIHREDPPLRPRHYAELDTCPAANIPIPEPLTPGEIQELNSQIPAVQLYWSILSSVAAAVVAPAVVGPITGTVLCGDSTVSGGQAALRLIGCPMHQLSPTSSAVTDKYRMLSEEHHFPIYIGQPTNRKAFTSYASLFEDHGPRNCFTYANEFGGMVAGSMGWNVLSSPYPITGLRPLNRIAPRVLPLFLAWLLDRKFETPRQSTHLETVVQAVADWFESVGGATDSVLRCLDLFVNLGERPDVANMFLRTLYLLQAERALSIVPTPAALRFQAHERQIKLPCLSRQDTIYVPQYGYRQLATQYGNIRPDLYHITRELEQVGLLRDEQMIDNEPYWGIREDRWIAYIHSQRALRSS